MEKNYKNKMVKDADTKALQEFFYPGGTEFEPITILAADKKEADALYESRKQLIRKD